MKTHIASMLLFALCVSSCFKLPLSATGKLDGSASGTVKAASTALGDGKEYASVDADSKEPVQLTTPKVSGLSGASVVVAPGSLGISVSIVVEQASDFAETSIASEMGLADNIQVTSASAGMIIRPSENVDLKKPLSLAMPLPSGLGFRLANLASKYVIFYKYFDPTEQKLVTGLKLVDGVSVKMVFDESSRKDVLQFEGYFGAYWAAILSREVAASEVAAPKASEEPIINKAKVAVYNSTGVVKEAEVVAKQAIPDLVWDKPSIKFSADTRIVSAAVAVPKGHKVSACKVDFFEAANLPKGISFEVPLGTSAEYNLLKTTEHSLVSRFRCVDEESRITITPWSNSVLIPALLASTPIIASAEISAEMCGTNPRSLLARGYNEQGQFVDFQEFAPVSKCKYRATINVNNSGNFYISNYNANIVCGLATHSLAEGEQVISCQKGSPGAVGSNHMAISAGNFYVDLDFTASALAPKLTLTRLPCDRGDFYLLFSENATTPSFPAISAASKMQHLGGCEYVYEKPTLPLTGNGSMQIRNAAGTYSCGSNVNWGANSSMYDQCGSGALRFDQFTAPEAAQSHRITLSLGDAAKRRTGNFAQESFVEYSVVSQCPAALFMLSAAKGTVPDHEKNIAYRQGACRYEFPVPVDNADLSVYNFKIANEAGAILCGGTSASGVISLNCNANAPAVNFEGQLGKTVRVTVSGNGLNGQLAGAEYSRMPMYCDGGIYLQPDISNGLRYTKEKAFQEVSECLFEKIWTPAANNAGFYLGAGSSNEVCGNYENSTTQPTLNGASGSLFCSGVQYANYMAQVRPVNIVAGTSYKITVDRRQRNTGRSFVSVSSVPTAPAGCGTDLYILANQVLPYTKSSETRMTYEGNCNYSFTLAGGSPNNEPMQYHIEDTAQTVSCYKGEASPGLNDSNLFRSEILDCSGASSENLSLNVYSNSVYRFYFKRDPNNIRNQLTIQNLSNNYGLPQIAGSAGALIPSNDRSFKRLASGGMDNSSTYIWTRTTAANFVLDLNGYGYEFCGFDSQGAAAAINNDMSVLCRYGSADSAPSFGPWPASTYMLEYTPPKSVEDLGRLKLRPYSGFTLNPMLAATAGNTEPNRYPLGNLGTEDAASSPGSLNAAATWTDSSGYLWAYGGDNGRGQMSSALWRYNPILNRWMFVDGALAGNELPVITGSVHPSAKQRAHSWYDSSNNRLFLFGGSGIGLSAGVGETNDLWYYQLPAGGWHFVKGGVNVNTNGVYYPVGTVSANAYPPARVGAASWSDSAGNLWLFGGYGNSGGRFNDIWKFVPTSNTDAAAGNWVWMGGAQENVDDLGTVGTYPSARNDAKAWYDQGVAYLYGGANAANGRTDMWSFTCNAQATDCLFQSLQSNLNNPGPVLARRGLFSPINRPRYDEGASNWVNPQNGDLWLYTDAGFWVYRPSINEWTGFPSLDANGYIQPLNGSQMAPFYSNTNFDAGNSMGRRQNGLSWTVGNRIFLYGGNGFDSAGNGRTWSDLWEVQFPQN